MKKKGILIFLFLFFIAAHQPANAQKVGFVDVKEIMVRSEVGKKALDEFRKSFEKDREAIQQVERDLKSEKEHLERQRTAGILKETALTQMEHEYQTKFREYQRLVANANDELAAKDRELSARLVPEIYIIINKIAEKEGYSLILDVNNSVVAYNSKGSNNLTERVLKEFNMSYKK